MQFSTVALFLFAVVGAVANPVEGSADGIDSREALIKYYGTCSRSKNECKYKGQNGKTTIVKCPKFANQKCTKDGAKCSFDSVSRKVTCD